jgi:hypothetical protein
MRNLGEYFGKAVRAASAAALAAFVVIGSTAAPAQAQWGQDNDYGRYGDHDRGNGRVDAQRMALVNGYAAGYEHGIQDRRNRESYDYDHATEYRRGSNGYERGYGNERDYQSWFRQGYAKGYSDGYYGRSRNRGYERGRNTNGYPYGNGGYYDNGRGDMSQQEVAQRAAQSGYRAGFERGQYDARQGVRRANPQGHGAYQYGFDGFDPDWGSASTYQRYYRQYLLQGYQDGFNRRTYSSRYDRRW